MKALRILPVLLLLAGFTLLDRPPAIYLAGDSTMAQKLASRRPETGWGEHLQQHFDMDRARVVNLARNGRSTRTFIEEGRWGEIADALRPGDYVFIQFGHNDASVEKTDRYTPPADYRRNLQRFVAEVRARQAHPVLFTPVMRRRFDENGAFYDAHGEYPDLVRAVAAELRVPLIDMHRSSERVIRAYGTEPSKALFLHIPPGTHANYPQGLEDNTHFSPLGAELMAGLAVDGIRESVPELAALLAGDHRARPGRTALMRISILPNAFLAAALAAGGLDAQADSTLLSPSRIAALPAAERPAWERYVQTSRGLAALDRESLAAEMRAAGIAQPIPTPPGGNFALEDGMEPREWFDTDAARGMADAIVSYQMPSGGWSRLADLTRGPRRPGQAYVAREDGGGLAGTFRERATTHHMRFLGSADRARGDERYRRAFLRGLDYVFTAQLPNGCWPLSYPLLGGHHDAVPFSDGAMVDVLRLLRDVARGDFGFVPDAARRRAGESLARGAGCTADSQVVVDGRRTGWAPQHDPLTLAPVAGPEPAALGGQHGSSILWFLMQLDGDDPRVAAAVRGGVGWVREAMLWGYDLPVRGRAVPRVGAGPVWARFYEIGSNRALFVRGDTLSYEWPRDEDDAGTYTWFNPYPAGVLTQYEGWSARHAAAPLPTAPSRANVVVDARHGGADGEAVAGVPTYRTIGAALAAAPADGRDAFVIAVRDGRYYEKLSIDRPNVHLVGESRDGTVLTYDVAAGHRSPGGWTYGTRGSWTLRIAAPGFRLERMTVENGFDFMANAARADDDPAKISGTQAVAVMLDSGSDRAVFRDCRLAGHQDTLFPNAGRSYFHRCEILGSVDFIFGAGRAVFHDCDIVSRDRGSATSNGYVTAPSTPISQPYGFLFLGGRLKKETPGMAPNSVTLGRPWHPSGRPDAIGSAVFIGVWMDDHVGATGWSPMNSTDAAGHRVENRPEDARFYEHGTTGPGAVASPTRRVLTPEQAAQYTIVRVLDGWDPRP